MRDDVRHGTAPGARSQTIRADHDVVVVGAGQAGLAAALHLSRGGLSYVVLERGGRPGDAWRQRYESLRLFSPREFNTLPGLPMAGSPDGYPSRDEMADYLDRYARHFELSVACGTAVVALRRTPNGFELETQRDEVLRARVVIVATGAFQRSVVPPFARAIPADVVQFTAQTYKRPTQLPPGPVLVVGGGGTGRQIAWEIAPERPVWLSVGRSPMVTPARVLGRDVLWWLDRIGALRADRDSVVGRLVRRRDAFPGLHLRDGALCRRGVQVVGRTVSVEGRRMRFAGNRSAALASIVWSAGYEDDTAWVRIPQALDPNGAFVHARGVSPVPGLYFVGRSWQTCRASGLVCGVSDDAARIVTAVRRHCSEVDFARSGR